MRRPRAASEHGFILVVVLMMLAVLAFLSASVIYSSRTTIRTVDNMVQLAKANAFASGGARLAALELLELREGRTSPIPINRGPYHCRLPEPGAVLRVVVEDEGGKVDLNTASDDLLVALFRGFGASRSDAEGIVARIADFRDPDDTPRVGGAEMAEYKAAGLKYGPKNADFESIEELEQVLDISPWLLARAMPFVTVHGRKSGVDADVMPPGLAAALAGEASGDADLNARYRRVLAPPAASRLPGQFIAPSQRRFYRVFATARVASGMRMTQDVIVEMPTIPGGLPRFDRWMTTFAPEIDVAPEQVAGLPEC